MFKINVNGTPVCFSKFFSPTDVEAVRGEIEKADAESVLFVDTPSTPHLVGLVRVLVDRGVVVHIRDHHDTLGETPREKEIHASVVDIQGILEETLSSYKYATREEHPACSSLLSVGEFQNIGMIVADPDPDGLTAALKSLGATYPELDHDAALLDGPRTARQGMSPRGMLLNRALGCIPPFDPARPTDSDVAKAELFSTFAKEVGGDEESFWSLVSLTRAGQEGIDKSREVAERIMKSAIALSSSVVMVDVTKEVEKFDMAVLMSGIEQGRKVTVMRKSNGPIAPLHGGVQYSIAVVRGNDINLQALLPEGFESSPEAGIISNVPFLLHLNEENWEGLKEKILAL
jgi:hypothetical protein